MLKNLNWTNAAILQSAIHSHGPVKIGVGANDFQSNPHGLVTPGTSGWAMYNYPKSQPEDHCVSLCGYGTLAALVSLFKQHNVTVTAPQGMPTGLCYAMFTWNSIGIIDQQSMLNMTYEAWIRNPVTLIVSQHQLGNNTTLSTPFVTSDNWVWFQGTDDRLWKVCVDGTEQSQPGNNTTSSSPFVVGEWVYFRGTDNKLWRMKTDGSSQNVINNNTTPSTPFVTSDNWVWFQGTDNKLWKVCTDGSQQSQPRDNTTSSSPFVVGEWVYFRGTDNKLWRMKTRGHRAFVFNYRTRGGREGRFTIGACSDWSCSAARAEAKRLRHRVDQGDDPQLDVKELREAPTVADLVKRFESEHLVRRRASTAADYRSMIRIHIAPHFGEKTKVADVTFDEIDRLHRKITAAGHKRRANTVVAVLSKMFALAVRWGMRSDNPCKGVEKNTETMRKRYMSGDELLRLTKALAAYPDKQTANVVRVLLLTGSRRGEALSMRWADVDPTTGTWSKPAASVKQNEDHIVPLSAPARQLLSEISEQQIKTSKRRQLGEFVFPGAGKTEHVVELKRTWRRLCKAAGITGLRIHDLRHSFASQLVSGGASLPLIGALLGHSNPSTTARYSHLFDDPQRAAVEKVGAVIGAAANKAEPAKKQVKFNR